MDIENDCCFKIGGYQINYKKVYRLMKKETQNAERKNPVKHM
jgi:hypothetical protein